MTGGSRGESIALLGDPFTVFNLRLLEPTTNPACGPTPTATTGIGTTSLGVGGAGSCTVQDCWSIGELDQKIPSGCHCPQDGGPGTQFRAQWYDPAGPPPAAGVNIDGQFFAMSLEIGSGRNAAHLYTADIAGRTAMMPAS